VLVLYYACLVSIEDLTLFTSQRVTSLVVGNSTDGTTLNKYLLLYVLKYFVVLFWCVNLLKVENIVVLNAE